MKVYEHLLDGRHRFLGYSTGDKDLSILFMKGDSTEEEVLHYHEESDEILITIRGLGQLWLEGEIYELKPGRVIRAERGEVHKLISIIESPFEMYSLKIPDERDDKIIVNEKECGLS